VAWPAQLAQRPTWVRFTLSERESNKTLVVGGRSYGDGRGYARPFRIGETEDHLLQPAGGPGDGPDVAVDLIGKVIPADAQTADLHAAGTNVVEEIDAAAFNYAQIRFKIDYENRGSQTANGALLEFQIPEKLRDMEVKWLHAPNVARDQITRSPGKINLVLPALEPGSIGSVTLGWTGCLTCTVASSAVSGTANEEYTALAKVTLEGDTDAGNNQANATARGLLSSPMGGILMDYADVDGGDAKVDHLVRGRAITCRDEPRLGGRAEPGMPVEIVIDGVVVTTVNADANGRFSVPATKLADGDHRIEWRYPDGPSAAAVGEVSFDRGYLSPNLWLRVNPSLPFDPVSLHFTDSQGRVTLPGVGRYGELSLAGRPFDVQLRDGETYQVEVDDCPGNLALERITLVIADVLVATLTDDDGDGRYEGQFTYGSTGSSDVTAAGSNAGTQSIALVATDGSTQSTFSGQVSQAPSGVVSNRSNGQPLPGVDIVASGILPTGETALFAPWNGSSLGQSNPVQSDGSGAYSFGVEPGVYRLNVTASGFQPYRTGDIDATEGSLATDVRLTPNIDAAADQTVYVDESGFTPALLTVKPGSVVEWINIDLGEHAVTGSNHDSGLLGTGDSYKALFLAKGTFAFADGVEPGNVATILVSDETVETMSQIYLPIVVGQ
jgi:plastocyanin